MTMVLLVDGGAAVGAATGATVGDFGAAIGATVGSIGARLIGKAVGSLTGRKLGAAAVGTTWTKLVGDIVGEGKAVVGDEFGTVVLTVGEGFTIVGLNVAVGALGDFVNDFFLLPDLDGLDLPAPLPVVGTKLFKPDLLPPLPVEPVLVGP